MEYSYLADGTRTVALDSDGEGLVYRGPFTYRRSASGALTLELRLMLMDMDFQRQKQK